MTAGADRHVKIWGVPPPGRPAVRPKGFLGIRVQDLETGDGVSIVEVIAGTEAARAGFETGDVLRKVGGVGVRGANDSVDLIGTYFEGEEAEFALERNGAPRVLRVRLGKRPTGLD